MYVQPHPNQAPDAGLDSFQGKFPVFMPCVQYGLASGQGSVPYGKMLSLGLIVFVGVK